MTRNITSYFHPGGGCGRGREKQIHMDIASKLFCLMLILISEACCDNDKSSQLQSSSPATSQKLIHATSIVGQWQLSNPVCKWDLLVSDSGNYVLAGRNDTWCGNDRFKRTYSSGNWYKKDKYYFLTSSNEINKLHDKQVKEIDKIQNKWTPSTIDTVYFTFDKTRFLLENDSLFKLDSKGVRDTFIVFALKR